MIEEHCACTAGAHFGFFCTGFRRLSDEEFRRQFAWIARTRPASSRKELEELANLYHLGRMEVTGYQICCDFETREHGGCDGWNAFDNRQIEGFYAALIGRPVEVA